jgi:hypothetical protein
MPSAPPRSVAGGRLASHDVKCGLVVANSRRERILRLLS